MKELISAHIADHGAVVIAIQRADAPIHIRPRAAGVGARIHGGRAGPQAQVAGSAHEEWVGVDVAAGIRAQGRIPAAARATAALDIAVRDHRAAIIVDLGI